MDSLDPDGAAQDGLADRDPRVRVYVATLTTEVVRLGDL